MKLGEELIMEVNVWFSQSNQISPCCTVTKFDEQPAKLLLRKHELQCVISKTRCEINIAYSAMTDVQRIDASARLLYIASQSYPNVALEFTTEETAITSLSLILALKESNILSGNLPELSINIIMYRFLGVQLPIITRQLARESDDANVTPLHLAVFYNDFDLVNALVDAGAFVNADGQYKKPVLLAIENGNFQIFRYLVDHGAVVLNDYLVDGSIFDSYIHPHCYLRLRDKY